MFELNHYVHAIMQIMRIRKKYCCELNTRTKWRLISGHGAGCSKSNTYSKNQHFWKTSILL